MRLRSKSAFTLVEIMVVVVIIGLLAAIAIAAFKRIKLKSQATEIANNIRVFSQAFEQYATEMGGWPANDNIGTVPAGMQGRINADVFARPMVGGHQWDWDTGVNGVTAGLSIEISGSYADSQELFNMVDKIIDDGNPATGSFQWMGDRYTYILQK